MGTKDAMTILILDDSEVLLAAARFRLERGGFAVLAARDVNELRVHLGAGPDLVVLDLQLSESGDHDLESVLEDARRAAPVLLFSALEEQLLAERAAALAVDGYVCKDAGLDALLARARALLGVS